MDLQNKPTMPGGCRFPLSNPHDAPIRDFVPKSNPYNTLISLHISSANQTKAAHIPNKRKISRALSFARSLYQDFKV